MNKVSLEQQILVIPNLLSLEECDRLIEHYENSNDNVKYEHSVNVITGHQETSSYKVKAIADNSYEYKLAFSKIEIALNKWIKHLENFNSYHVEGLRRRLNFPHLLRILKYDVGEFIHPHVDVTTFGHASCTLNLNDEYTGGIFSFFNRKFDVRLGKGDAIVFPISWFWVHEVTPIISGTRYALNTFILSQPRSIEKSIEKVLANAPQFGKFNIE